MNDTHTERNADDLETAVSPTHTHQERLDLLFNRGWVHLLKKQWQHAEEIFAQIEAHNPLYEQDGLTASYLRQKTHYQQKATAALKAGKLKAALTALKKADDFEQAKEVHTLLAIHELEAKAAQAMTVANYQEAAWIYDHLLNEYPAHEKTTMWQIKKESCWEAELLPFFDIGVKALEKKKWRTAYNAFAQVLVIDPYFRKDGRSAAVLSEMARKEVILQADQRLRQGQVQKALAAYREVGHLARIENVSEFLQLRQHEEEAAQELEANGKWQEAADKYKYLCTLYYDDDGRTHWQAAAERCLEEHKLKLLYQQGITAYNDEQWPEAAQIFGQIIALRPEYSPGEQPARKLYRMAHWRNIFCRFTSKSDNLPPRINTGKIS